MTGMSLEIQDRGAGVALRRAVETLENPLDVFSEIGNDLAEMARLRFVMGESPYGEAWEPLKTRQGQPLRDTGRLMNSITHDEGGDYIEVGTNVKYAAVHQFGATIRPKRRKFLVFKPKGASNPIFAREVTIPARPFLPTGDLPGDWLDVIISRVNEAVGGGETA